MKFVIVSVAALYLLVAFAASAGPLDVHGIWMTQSRTGLVQIKDCGDGTPCGTLIWVDAPVAAAQLDENNPDPDLRARSLIGVKMLWGFSEKSTRWSKGKIYSPEEGKTYRSAIRQRPDGNLEVKGCIGPFCQAQLWTKVQIDGTMDDQP